MKEIKNCSECEWFEHYLNEFEDGFGIVEKGRCHKYNIDEVWGTKTACDD